MAKGKNFPEDTEVAALLVAARGHPRDYLFLYLSANLGTRRGETVALSRESMREIDQGYVLVDRLKQKQKVIDKVAIPAAVKDRIKAYMATMPPGQKWLFPSRWEGGKNHMTTVAANDIWLRYKAIAKIRPHLTLHSLRHYKGMKVWEGTHNIKAVQNFLGHRSEKNSWIYVHISMNEQREIAEKIGEVK